MLLAGLLLLSAACGGSEQSDLRVIGPDLLRQGEVIRFSAEIPFSWSQQRIGTGPVWSVEPAEAGLITDDGRFVGYRPGAAAIVATADGKRGRLPVTIVAREGLQGEFAPLVQGVQTARFNSDLWLHGRFGFTGTWLGGAIENPPRLPGDTLFAWDLRDPLAPVMSAVLSVDARTVNDVKISADGTLAVLTHEGSADGLNGITLLDLTDPLQPTEIIRFTDELETGVHNVWIEENFIYAVVDGIGNGLRIIDISNLHHPFLDPTPTIAARFVAETSFLHDVLVRDGLAFLSHWDDGLIILDVGSGIAGGTPVNPVEVGRVQTAGGQTHNAWFWPAAGYVFVGEEDFETPGVLHVVDVQDPFQPEEVATFSIPGETPHNFWLDEERGILYAGWYSAGLRAIDVSGELLGELEKQDREIAAAVYGTDAGCRTDDGTCAWAPQLHNGLVFVSDLNTGLWAFRPLF
jgi:hypothetical protein